MSSAIRDQKREASALNMGGGKRYEHVDGTGVKCVQGVVRANKFKLR